MSQTPPVTINRPTWSFVASLGVHLGAALALLWMGQRSLGPRDLVEITLVPPRGHSLDPTSRGPTDPPRAASPRVQREKTPVPQDVTRTRPEEGAASAAPISKVMAGPLEGQGSVAFGTPDGREMAAAERYVQELRLALEQAKTYPAMARKLRQQGRVLVRFTLKNDGTVLAADVLEGCPFGALNEAARELIGRLNGLKPFPEEVRRSEWEFTLPIEYRL